LPRNIVVVGSLNMDLVVRVPRLPAPGETVGASDFRTVPGGKGANQACAAGRLGGRVRMVGRVGHDGFGDRLRRSLAEAGVDVARVGTTPDEATGVALILVEAGGQNQIAVAAGANGRLGPDDVAAAAEAFDGGLLLVQLETPLPAVEAAVSLARRRGMTTILDPAPAVGRLDGSLLAGVDVLTPNETEALQLLGRRAGPLRLEDAPEVAERLREAGPGCVVLKLGERGAFLADGRLRRHFPARPVEAVDATAAGDTFNGALAVALAEGRALDEAVAFANVAASIAVTRVGAQSSAPSREEVEASR
jgi:ribokinase